MTVGYSIHGPELALLAALGVVILVLLGPIPFFFASSIVSQSELIVIAVLGVIILLAWIRAVVRGAGHYMPYISVSSWALMGAWFCVALYFAHAAAH
ncbi:hypothetical protein [Oceanicoccus sagamiensis]|uniref:hypothetical protein n=1 Tax=Oceanicoccus sagamiensis TaxID=716816 RepID=UPI0012F4A994|nr:hypothetical protein [Oceanicoccus sagamiensis]